MNLSYFHSLSHDARADLTQDLCAQHNCPEKKRKLHYHQLVHRDWHPHPPQAFLDWFAATNDALQGINPTVAWNSHNTRTQYLEEKSRYGI